MDAGCAKGWVQSTINVIATEGIFNNHGSIAEDQEFVCQVVAKLLASGAVTEIQRALVKHWRSKGFRIFTYLDDGAGADQVLNKAMKMSAEVRRDIALSGFIVNEKKKKEASRSPRS